MKTVLIAAMLFSGTAFAQTKEADLKPGTVVKDCPTCPDLVVVPPGEFMMGSAPEAKDVDVSRGETPQVKMKIPRAFLMGRFELTVAQYREFVKETGYQTAKKACRVWDNEFVDKDDASWENPYQPQRPQPEHPVGCVSWNDAQAYLNWLGKKTGKQYRLPSTAEWEYAARAGTTTSRFWGDFPDDACDYANTFDISSKEKYPFAWTFSPCKDGYAEHAPVGKFKPNAFGLHDMVGNVWEWLQDCYAGSHQGRPKDGRAWEWDGGCEMRETRGGAWMSAPERNRIAWPGRDPAERKLNYFGFRVARDLDSVYSPPYSGAQIRRLTLFTGDIAKAKQFWVDALGYEVRLDNPAFGGADMAKTLNLKPEARAHFVILEPGKTDGPLLGLIGTVGQTLAPLDRSADQAPKAGDHLVVVKVKDIAAVFAKFKDMGVRVITPPGRLDGTGGTSVVGAEGAVVSPDGTRVVVQQVESGG
ncbi:MAG: SUMF1/EgtB/PvdO family nonheme iron enzyme [Rhodospirillaceae bacterium]|nr:SUMF1/EgtB/PvdO family nonheme iron enzyme [Rhodospirillaceae bacterium]